MSSSGIARSSRHSRRPSPVPHVMIPPGGLGIPWRPGRYAPHFVIVIVLVLAVIGPPGQVAAVLFALAAIFPLLGFRGELA
jgi:hypothetical protein